MDARETSKVLPQPSITLFIPNSQTHSTMKFNELRANKGNSNSFTLPPNEASFGEHTFEMSDSESSSEDKSKDEEVILNELMKDGKTNRKIEQLAAMVGLDTTEPVIVLTEVVRILKHLKTINQHYSAT